MNQNHFSVRQKLGDILISHGLLSSEQLDIAMKYQSRNYQKIGRILVKLGFITDKELTETLARQLSIPLVDLEHYQINPDALGFLPAQFVKEATVIPISIQGQELTVAFSDPLDYDTYQSVVFKSGKSIKQVIADREQIKRKIFELYNIEVKETSFEASLEELKSFDSTSVKGAVDIIWHFTGILKKVHQYSPESKTVKTALNWAYETIHQYLKKHSTFNMYIADNGVFVNNEKLPSKDFVDSFADFLRKVYLNSFIIEEGLSFEEFTNMMTVFHYCYSKPDEYSQMTRLFRESGIINAKLGEIAFVQETTTFQSNEELIDDYLEGKISLIPIINQLKNMIIDSPSIITDIIERKKIAYSKKGLKIDDEREEFSKVIYRIIRIMTLEDDRKTLKKLEDKVTLILSNINSNDLLNALISESTSEEQRKVLEHILINHPTYDNFIHVYFASLKMSNSIDPYYLKNRNQIKTLITRLKPFLEKEELIANKEQENSPKDKIVPPQPPKEDPLTQLLNDFTTGKILKVDKVFDSILCDSPEIREKFTQRKEDLIAIIIQNLISTGYIDNVEMKLKQLFTKLKQSKDVHSFTSLIDIFKKIYIHLFKNPDMEFIHALSFYIMDLYKSLKGRDEKKYYLMSIKNYLEPLGSDENIKLLIEEFKNRDESGRENLIKLIGIYEDFIINPLINKLKTSQDKVERIVLIDILSLAEKKSVGPLLEELVMQNPWFVIRNAVLILGKIGNPLSVGFFKQALKHKDERVKREAFKALRRFGGSTVEDLMAQLLESPDFDTQCRAIRTLGRMRTKKHKDKLRNILSKRNFNIQEEFAPLFAYVCHTLGKTEDTDSVKLLVDIAKPKLLSKQWALPKLRASACWALGQIANNQAIKILNKLSADNEKIVRKTARHALKRFSQFNNVVS
jgi:HEAT repeat protein